MGRRGYTLLEVMITIGIFACIVFGFLAWVHTFQETVGTLNKSEQIDLAFIKTVSAFGNDDRYCEFIFKGKTFNPTTGLSLSSIDFHDDNGAILGNVLKVGAAISPRSEVSTSAIQLKKVTDVFPNNFLANLEITLKKTLVNSGSDTVVRIIPIFVTVDGSNVILTCSTSAESMVIVKNRVCEIRSDGFEHYDVTVDDCVLNAHVKWFQSLNPRQAECPSGWRPAMSAFHPDPQGIVCASGSNTALVNMPKRTYASGAVADSKAAVWTAVMDATKTKCLFSFPVGVNESTYSSKVKCTEIAP